jgi:hypothetical protein
MYALALPKRLLDRIDLGASDGIPISRDSYTPTRSESIVRRAPSRGCGMAHARFFILFFCFSSFSHFYDSIIFKILRFEVFKF